MSALIHIILAAMSLLQNENKMKTNFIAIKSIDGKPCDIIAGDLEHIALSLLRLSQYEQAKAVATMTGKLDNFKQLENTRDADRPNDGWYIREIL